MNAVGTGPGWGALLWFVLVLAAIPLVLWVLKRSHFGGMGGAAGGAARTVGVLPLSAAQRVVTVEVGQGADRRWLVLGVTAHSITALHTLPPQDGVGAEGPLPGPQPSAAAQGFASMLARLRTPGDGRDAR